MVQTTHLTQGALSKCSKDAAGTFVIVIIQQRCMRPGASCLHGPPFEAGLGEDQEKNLKKV